MTPLAPSWTTASIDDVADVLDSRRVPVNRKERALRPGNVPYYGATGQVGWIDAPLFDEELCLVGEDGAPFLDRSKPKAYLIDGPSWVNNHAHVLRARTITSNRYLKYVLDFADYEPVVNGTTRLKLTRSGLSQIPIPLPPLAEQRRIVAAIEEQFSRLEANIELLGAAESRLERMHAIVLTHALSRFRAVVPLREVAEVRLGRQRSPKNHAGPNMTPYLRAANVTWSGLALSDVKQMHFSETEVDTYRLQPGDIVLSEASGSAGEVGKPAIWNGQIEHCCFQNTLIRVRTRGPSPDFLRLVFLQAALTGQFAKAAPGVGIHHLGSSRLALWPIPVASEAEQAETVAVVEQQLSLIDSLRAAVVSAQKRSAALRRAILRRAFRGELVLQDPTDEPASALLERIRAERAAASKPTRRRSVPA